MSLADIREQVKAILSSVDGVGVVHDFQRWSSNRNKFINFFRDPDGKINGWCITRNKTPATCGDSDNHSRIHNLIIRGYYGMKDADATELVFQDLVESICETFASKYQLNDTAEDTSPMKVDLVDLRMFGGVLCHYCELSLEAEEFQSWS